MCGRYTLHATVEELIEQFKVDLMAADTAASYNVAPTQTVAVVVADSAPEADGERTPENGGERTLDAYRWGLVPSWARDMKGAARMINARAETVAEKPAFRRLLTKRRCIVPASGFYEWRDIGEKQKQPYYFQERGERPFAFAGLWDAWLGPEGDWLRTCTILTTTANDLVAPVHERMPVILTPEGVDAWLTPGTPIAGLRDLLTPYPDARMRAHPVGHAVNSPAFNSPEAMQPINSA